MAAVKEKQKGKDKRLAMLEKEVEITNRDLTLFKVRARRPTQPPTSPSRPFATPVLHPTLASISPCARRSR